MPEGLGGPISGLCPPRWSPWLCRNVISETVAFMCKWLPPGALQNLPGETLVGANTELNYLGRRVGTEGADHRPDPLCWGLARGSVLLKRPGNLYFPFVPPFHLMIFCVLLQTSQQ